MEIEYFNRRMNYQCTLINVQLNFPKLISYCSKIMLLANRDDRE